jgi:thiol-disulfide isomerase/thioredoxin
MKRSAFTVALIVLCSSNFAKAQSWPTSKIIYLNDTSVNFNGLINQFKGKIIYVDIWASWCAPCRKELEMKKYINEFRDYAQKNHIIILYICCDKQGNIWKQFVNANKLVGYHMLVNKYIDQDFHTIFSTVQKRQGVIKRSFYIPRNMIIDQNGAVVDSSADRQGSPSLYPKISRILNKQASL